MAENNDQEQALEVAEEEGQEIPIEGGEDSKPGHLELEEYVEQGGDPEMYRGKKAFQQFHDVKQELSSFKRSNKDLSNNVAAVLDQQKQFINKQNNDAMRQNETRIVELEERLNLAHEELDSKKAVKIQKQIDKLETANDQAKQAEKTQVQTPQSHIDEVLDFREDNPELDQNAEEFDTDLDKQVTELVGLSYTTDMSDREVRRLLKGAYKKAKSGSTKYNQKQIKTAPNTATPTKKGVKPNKAAKLSKLDPSAKGIYKHFMDNGNKDAASDFLDSIEV